MKDVGTQKPTKGTELTNEKLEAMLKSKKSLFTQKEWKELAVNMGSNEFTKSDGRYFKVDATFTVQRDCFIFEPESGNYFQPKRGWYLREAETSRAAN